MCVCECVLLSLCVFDVCIFMYFYKCFKLNYASTNFNHAVQRLVPQVYSVSAI